MRRIVESEELLPVVAVDLRITGLRIRAIRRELGWTQRRMAAATGRAVHTVWAWETGHRLPDAPTLLALVRLGREVGVRISDGVHGPAIGAVVE